MTNQTAELPALASGPSGVDIKTARYFTSGEYQTDVEGALEADCAEHRDARRKILGQHSLIWSMRLEPTAAARRLESLVPCDCPEKAVENFDVMESVRGLVQARTAVLAS